jgi:hypothetical protein
MDAFLSQVKADNPRCNQVFGLNAGLGAKKERLEHFLPDFVPSCASGKSALDCAFKSCWSWMGINDLVI